MNDILLKPSAYLVMPSYWIMCGLEIFSRHYLGLAYYCLFFTYYAAVLKNLTFNAQYYAQEQELCSVYYGDYIQVGITTYHR